MYNATALVASFVHDYKFVCPCTTRTVTLAEVFAACRTANRGLPPATRARNRADVIGAYQQRTAKRGQLLRKSARLQSGDEVYDAVLAEMEYIIDYLVTHQPASAVFDIQARTLSMWIQRYLANTVTVASMSLAGALAMCKSHRQCMDTKMKFVIAACESPADIMFRKLVYRQVMSPLVYCHAVLNERIFAGSARIGAATAGRILAVTPRISHPLAPTWN